MWQGHFLGATGLQSLKEQEQWGERKPEDQPRTCCSTSTNSGIWGLLNEEAVFYLWGRTKESTRHPVAPLPFLSMGPVVTNWCPPSGPHPVCCPILAAAFFPVLGLPLSTAQELCFLEPAGTSPRCRCAVMLFTSLTTCFSSSTPQVGSLISSWTNHSYFYLLMLISKRLINCLVAWKQLLPSTHSHAKRTWLLKVHVQIRFEVTEYKAQPAFFCSNRSETFFCCCLGIWENSLICQMIGYCVCTKYEIGEAGEVVWH